MMVVFIVIMSIQASEFCALMMAENGGFCRNYGGFYRDNACPIQRILHRDGGGKWRTLT